MDMLIALASYAGCILGSLLIADFVSGLMHWAEDTWLKPGSSRLLDRFIVSDNIEHHRMPGKIRCGSYWETNRVCIALAVIVAAILTACHVQLWEPYLVVALLSHSNQVHRWAHSSRPPRPVRVLQRTGLLQSTAHHAEHHKPPYASRFCAMTAFLNPVLDGLRFWRGLEHVAVACGATVQRATPSRGGY
jgi:ubiquitin-conjugating enzyme E2 variant